MAKFCCRSCRERGSNCANCKMLKELNNEEEEYICKITGEKVEPFEINDCDNFECFLVE